MTLGVSTYHLKPGTGFARGEEWPLTKPAPTVTTSGMSGATCKLWHAGDRDDATLLHTERQFTIAEIRRLCGFPDDFELTGSYAQQWKRLGNAVPPLMARAWAEVIRDRILIPYRDAHA